MKKALAFGLFIMTAAMGFYAIHQAEPSKVKPKGKTFTSPMTQMQFVLIPAGTYKMGPLGAQEEKTVGEFYFGVHEVTQGEWQAVMGTTPWKGKPNVKEGSFYPATYVSWDDAKAFSRKLGKKDGVTYRLPTEEEWEYACRAGTTTVYSFGDEEGKLGEYAWYNESASRIGEKYAHEVGKKKANGWGLYDMHGNVYEWCENKPTYGSGRWIRGGGWGDSAGACEAAFHYIVPPRSTEFYIGLRLALVP